MYESSKFNVKIEPIIFLFLFEIWVYVTSVQILPLYILYVIYRVNFWPKLEFKLCLFFHTNFMCNFEVFLLKMDVLVHYFWAVQAEVKMVIVFGIYRPFPFIWDQTWPNFVFTIYRKEGGKLWPQWQVNLEAEK